MSDWTWRPDDGAWRLEDHGYPAMPEPVSVGTAQSGERDSYDYWRQVAFADFEADPLGREAAQRFEAQATGLAWEKADWFVSTSDAVSGRRTRRHIDADGLDCLSIGLVIQGRRDAEHDGDERVSTTAGGLFVYDGTVPSTVSWTAHKVAFLVVRRDDARSVLGTDIGPASSLTKRIEASPLGRELKDRMTSMARHIRSAGRAEQALLLRQAVEVAVHAMAGPEPAGPSPRSAAALWARAAAYIDRHLTDPNLNAARVARAAGCSRATLYRLFSDREGGIAAYIRDRRLDRARSMIEGIAGPMTITEIAVKCGLYDTSNFARQFRGRFGVAPTDLRNGRR